MVLSIVAAIVASASLSAAPVGDFSKRSGSGGKVTMPEYKPGEVIVIWKDGASVAEKASAGSSANVERVLDTGSGRAGENRQLLKLAPGVSAEAAANTLNSNPAVKAAGLNRLRKLSYTPSSPDFPNQWGLNNTGQNIEGQVGTPDADIDATDAWNIERGNSHATTVAVIDSGIDLSHPNLSGRLWTNTADPVNGVDDDGNGYIDDNHGYNWAGISNYAATNSWPFGADSGSQYVAQKFKAQGTSGQCRVKGLEMLFDSKVGNPSQTITYAIRSSLTGANIVATNPITPDRIDSGGSYVYQPFTSVANLTPGNNYYFVAYTSSVDASNYYTIVDHTYDSEGYDSYLEGSEWWNFDGTWTEFPSDDFYFKASGYYYNRDNNGHGTHTCGIVGAADSGSGSVGVAPGNATRLMALKAGDSSGSLYSADWMDAIDYASAMGADVISMSFGGTGSDPAEQAVINDAHNNGLTLFASSGNSGDSTMEYPVGYNHVIGVGATDNQDNIASFSTYNSSVDVSAPGVDYYSTMPGYPVTLNEFGYAQSYDYLSGTSMACPMAAGLSALVHSKNPALTPAQVESVIEAHADDKGGHGRDDYYGYGRINAFNTLSPSGTSPWYLAEGTTAWGFGCYITIQNPNATAVTAKVTYMPAGSANVVKSVTLPAKSQTTLNPGDVLGQKDFSTRVVCTEGKTIAVDRTMTWTGPGAASSEAHSSVGVTSSAKIWYLPEGSSAWGFECWLLIQNPNTTPANCNVTYMIEDGAPKTVSKTIPASSRSTFNIADDIGAKDASIKVVSNIPVIPERAMYRNNRREGHDSIGTTTPASDYFLAEGTTAWGFTTYVLVQNPNTAATDVTVTYMTPSGAKAQAPFSLAGNSRKTIRVNDVAGMGNTDFSTKVHGSKPLIAERSMYWDNGTGEACHDSIGMDKAHTTFYLPDGQTSEGCETWTLVQNPNASAVTVEISYLTPTGQGNVVKTETIPASSRQTFGMLSHSGINGRASIMVTSKTSGKPIMVERAMYWNNKGAGTDTIGGYSD
jgi:subtilisin family serine protease